MTTRSTLIAARALVARGWCQGVPARDIDGCVTYHNSPSATCWCAWGAITRKEGREMQAKSALARAVGVRDTRDISLWNDAPGRTQAEVLAAFDRAIEECGE